MSGFVMELADKWDKLTLAGEPTAFRKGYEQALKDCAKEVRMALQQAAGGSAAGKS